MSSQDWQWKIGEAVERVRTRYEFIGRKTGAPFLALVYPPEAETAFLKEWHAQRVLLRPEVDVRSVNVLEITQAEIADIGAENIVEALADPMPGSEAVRSGPLGQWVDAAREFAIHADLPGWIEVAMSQLDRHCTRVAPDDSQWDSTDEPTPVTAAKFICTKPGQMVTEALTHANGYWAGQVHTVVIAPLRQQISEKQERQKALKAELKASTEGDTTVHAIGELRAALDRLKIEIRDLQAQVGDIQGRCDRLRALITRWHCPGVDGWESWLAEQPLFDAISSVDGRRRPPITVQEWIAQEQSYVPDINDGVRVNIAPLQKAGLLAADVLAKKDLDKAIADRAEWRRDERRWVREGKLPQPGWWPEGKDEG